LRPPVASGLRPRLDPSKAPQPPADLAGFCRRGRLDPGVPAALPYGSAVRQPHPAPGVAPGAWLPALPPFRLQGAWQPRPRQRAPLPAARRAGSTPARRWARPWGPWGTRDRSL